MKEKFLIIIALIIGIIITISCANAAYERGYAQGQVDFQNGFVKYLVVGINEVEKIQ